MRARSSILITIILGASWTACDQKSGSTSENEPQLRPFTPLSLSDKPSEKPGMQEALAEFSALRSNLKSESGTTAVPREEPKKEYLENIISQLFHPKTLGCLPNGSKFEDKLSHSGKWVPEDVRKQVEKIGVQKVATANEAISYFLNRIEYTSNGKTETRYVTGTGLFQNIEPSKFILSGFDNFVYNIDCSGYLSASAFVVANVPAVELKNSADIAMKSQKSLAVIRATVVPPIAAALDPENAPANIGEAVSLVDRIDLLRGILATIPENAPEEAKVGVSLDLDVLWTSVSGESSFQGLTSASGSSGGGFGFVTAQASTSAGATLSRSVRFGNFDTYLIGRNKLQRPIERTVAQIRSDLVGLVPRAALIRSPKRNGDGYEFAVGFPRSVCQGEWSAMGAAGLRASTTFNDKDGTCVIQVLPASAFGNATPAIKIERTFRGATLTYSL